MKRSLLSFAFLLLGTFASFAQTVTLTWTNPTTYVGGGALPLSAIQSIDIWDSSTQSPSATKIGTVTTIAANGTFTTPTLLTGFHNFTVTVNTTAGGVSAMSNVFSVQITATAPSAVTNLTGTVGP